MDTDTTTTRKSCKTHCCEKHGCKYGYSDCPVENKKVMQEYPCEFCPTWEDIAEAQRILAVAEWMNRRGFSISKN